MSSIVVVSRPIIGKNNAYILLNTDDKLEKYELAKGSPTNITVVDPSAKYCCGWYDIQTHTNYICENHRPVNKKYESCYDCRNKTGFNPAFYNTDSISALQEQYNQQPHTTYIAYFGDGLAKAGIMSDSRGLERIYEQGALFHNIIGKYNTANEAHAVEQVLIAKGFKNSITKTQKQNALKRKFDIDRETTQFAQILAQHKLSNNIAVNVDKYFYGAYPDEPITPFVDNPISGVIAGVVGRYLILRNNSRLYGAWLNDLNGFSIQISTESISIKSEPTQSSLFD